MDKGGSQRLDVGPRRYHCVCSDARRWSAVLFNSKLRKRAVVSFNEAVERYVASTSKFEAAVAGLYDLRVEAAQQVRAVSDHINALANVPREFEVSLEWAATEVRSFEGKQNEIKKAEVQAKRNAKGSAAGASLSALGVAVATMGPTVASPGRCSTSTWHESTCRE